MIAAKRTECKTQMSNTKRPTVHIGLFNQTQNTLITYVMIWKPRTPHPALSTHTHTYTHAYAGWFPFQITRNTQNCILHVPYCSAYHLVSMYN